jgi:hypothetical protein
MVGGRDLKDDLSSPAKMLAKEWAWVKLGDLASELPEHSVAGPNIHVS